MDITITELLREFPRVRRAVFAGETVIIRSREGNMRLTLDSSPVSLVGGLKGLLVKSDDTIDQPTTEENDWNLAL